MSHLCQTLDHAQGSHAENEKFSPKCSDQSFWKRRRALTRKWREDREQRKDIERDGQSLERGREAGKEGEREGERERERERESVCVCCVCDGASCQE